MVSINSEQKKEIFLIVLAVIFILLSFIHHYFIFLYPIITVILTFKKTEHAFAFIVFTSGFNFAGFFDGFIGPLHPNSIQVISMILFAGISIIRLKRITLKSTILPFTLFVLYALLSFFWTPARFLAIKMIGKFVLISLLLVLFSNYKINMKTLLRYFIIGAFISVIVFNGIYYGLLGSESIFIDSAGRSRLLGGASGATAYVFFMGVSFIAGIILFEYTKQKKYLLFSLIFFLYGVLSYARMGIAAMIIVGLLFLIKTRRYKLFSISIIGILLIFSTISYFFLLQTYTGVKDTNSLEVITAGRTNAWEVLLDDWSENPLVGKGLEFSTSRTLQTVGFGGAHSDYLKVLVDLGIFGLVLFLTFLLSLFKKIVRLKKSASFILLYFVFYTLASLTSNMFILANLVLLPTYTMFGYALNKHNNFGGKINEDSHY